MFSELKDRERVQLTEQDIQRIAFPSKVKILVYEDLAKMDTINDIFPGDTEAIALLYQTTRNSGHWVTLLFNKRARRLTFYDSYGFRVDDELKLEHYNHEAHLTRILGNSEDLFDIFDENNKRMQQRVEDVNTCGRYTALRCRYKYLKNSEFNDMIKPIMLKHPDEVVTMLTFLD